jgi:CRISPR-associated endonuclease/helicase Cas3
VDHDGDRGPGAAGAGAGSSVRSIWGKSKGSPRPHLLICHVLETVAVAEALLPVLLGPRCREALRLALTPVGEWATWVALFCGVHDLGKCSPAFQALELALAQNLLDPVGVKAVEAVGRLRTKERLDTPHGVITAVQMKRILQGWGLAADQAQAVAAALGGHHGSVPEAEHLRHARFATADHGRRNWAARCDAVVQYAVRECGLPTPTDAPWHQVTFEAPALVGLAGLTSISDWIASDKRFFPPTDVDVDLDGYLDKVRPSAATACAHLGLMSWTPPEDSRFSSLFPHDRARPVQAVVEQVSQLGGGPVLVVVEAPTGEGKTKAGLQCATAVAHRLGSSGCFVAMPTRATSKQMLGSLQELLLGSAVTARLVQGLSASGIDAYADDGRSGKRSAGDAEAKSWFWGKRGLLTCIGTGPVDQVLMGGIRGWHVFVRLTALSGKVLIIDEVHAYDTYMSTLLDRLLGWLGLLGVSVIMLSATLPTGRRQELVDSWRAGVLNLPRTAVPDGGETSLAYPRVTWSDGVQMRSFAAEVSPLNGDRRIRLARIDDADLVDWVLERTADGGCAAVIHNTVRRTEATWSVLCDAVARLPQEDRPRLLLLHAKVPHRMAVERELTTVLGPPPGGCAPDAQMPVRPRRLVVVASPLLGQSLDLDVDVMVSDLAPVDDLVQRMGRLHRHPRPARPDDVSVPTMAITGVRERRNGPHFAPGWTSVYRNLLLLRTWAAIRDRCEIRCPDEVPGLIDAVYGADDLVPCPPGWRTAWNKAIKQWNEFLERQHFEAEARYLPVPLPDVALHELTTRPRQQRTRQGSGRPDTPSDKPR